MHESFIQSSEGSKGLASMLLDFISRCFPVYITVNAQRYRVKSLLAEGGFSFVWLVESGGEFYAIKEIPCRDRDEREAVRREVDAHSVYHPAVLTLLGHSIGKNSKGVNSAFLLFPLMRNSLQDTINLALKKSSSLSLLSAFPINELLQIAIPICEGVKAMHAAGLTHRDICPRNILLSPDLTPILCDLGSAAPALVVPQTRFEADMISEEARTKSSAPYRAPELWQCEPGQKISTAVDVFSLCATFFALAFGYSPFESIRGDDGRLKVCDPSHVKTLSPPQFPDRALELFPQSFIDLIKKGVSVKAEDRPTIDEMISELKHIHYNT